MQMYDTHQSPMVFLIRITYELSLRRDSRALLHRFDRDNEQYIQRDQRVRPTTIRPGDTASAAVTETKFMD